jgi:hypothetical protein
LAHLVATGYAIELGSRKRPDMILQRRAILYYRIIDLVEMFGL